MEVERKRAGPTTRVEVHQATKWTHEIIAGALYGLKESGESVNPSALERNHKQLYQAIRNKPGGWRRIIEMAGYDPEMERSHRNAWRNPVIKDGKG